MIINKNEIQTKLLLVLLFAPDECLSAAQRVKIYFIPLFYILFYYYTTHITYMYVYKNNICFSMVCENKNTHLYVHL